MKGTREELGVPTALHVVFSWMFFSLHLSEIAETQISHGAMSVIDAMLNVLKVLAEAAAVVCLHIFACSCSTNVVYITVVVARRTTATNILLFPYMFWHISISNLL